MSKALASPGAALAFAILTLIGPFSAARAEGVPAHVPIGAIRWDNWHNESPEKEVLGKAGAEKRLPFFALRNAKGELLLNGDIEPVQLAEIAYAQAMGLDYFLFGYYPETGSWGRSPRVFLGLNRALSTFLGLPDRRGMKFALLINQLFPVADIDDVAGSIGEIAAHPDYLKTFEGAVPIFILGHDGLDWRRFFGTDAEARRAVEAIRSAVRTKSGRDSVLILMHWDAAQAKAAIGRYGLDMMSSYAQAPPRRGVETSFSECHAGTRRAWDNALRAEVPLVPNVTLGWDPRPRDKVPAHVGTPPRPSAWCAEASAAELRQAFDEATRLATRPGANPAFRSIVVYAWNEFTEGGWMAPDGADGPSRMARMRQAIGRQPLPKPVTLNFPSPVPIGGCPVRTTARHLEPTLAACTATPQAVAPAWPCPVGTSVASDRVRAPSGFERAIWSEAWTTRVCSP